METQLGYMDEKELGVQKPKKPPEIQVWKMLVFGSLVDVGCGLGLVAFSGPRTSSFKFRPLGLGLQIGSNDGNQESGFPAQCRFPAFHSYCGPRPCNSPSLSSVGPANCPGQSGR